MQHLARLAASWTLFATGSCLSRLMKWNDRLDTLHNRVMELSWRVQGQRENGPWLANVSDAFIDD